MAQLTTTSNPTGIQEIYKKDVQIDISEESPHSAVVSKLNLLQYELPNSAHLICIASCGSSVKRFELGTVEDPSLTQLDLMGIVRTKPLRFRIIAIDQRKKIIASIEGLKANDGADADSLIALEGADLGQLLWALDVRDDQFLIKYNWNVFHTSSFAGAYVPFYSLVMPAALKEILGILAEEPDRIDDPADFFSDWREFLNSFGGIPLPDEGASDDEIEEWSSEILDNFCRQFEFANLMKHELGGTSDDD